MSAFHEVLLPLPFALGASGGPERRVGIVTLGSRRGNRNTPRAHGRRRYDIGGAGRTLYPVDDLIAVFEGRRGRSPCFRLRHPLCHNSSAPSPTPPAANQSLGFGTGTQTLFQLQKSYGAGVEAYLRPITKPVAGSVSIAVNGVALAPAGFSVDTVTGQVTLTTPPASGATVTAGFSFDTPVRFDTERLDLSIDAFGAGRAISAPLVEILA